MSSPATLEVRGLHVRFGGHHALAGADLDVVGGVVTGLIGPNGAGKTTAFNAITGLQPSEGTVHLDGEDISSLAPHRRARRGIARTFQRLEVFGSLSVRDNIRTAAEIRRGWTRDRTADVVTETERIIDRVGLRAAADERVDALSTGLARLVEVGRALAVRPRVLLLDEPASGLDERETAGLAALLGDVASEGTAVLIVEHDIHLVMSLCAHVHVLDFGRIIAAGPPASVQQNQQVRDAYLGTGGMVGA